MTNSNSKKDEGWRLNTDSNTVSTDPTLGTGTITDVSSGTAISGDYLVRSASGISYQDSSMWTTGTCVTLGMKDFKELIKTADNRGEILLAYGEMIRDKLASLPNYGGLNTLEDYIVPINFGYNLACEMAIGWGYTLKQLGFNRVYSDGTFEFMIEV